MTLATEVSSSSQGADGVDPNGNEEDGLINQQQNLNCNAPVNDAQLLPATNNAEPCKC